MSEPMTDEEKELGLDYAEPVDGKMLDEYQLAGREERDWRLVHTCIEIRRLRAELRDTKEELEDVTNDLGGKTHMLMKAEAEVERLKDDKAMLNTCIDAMRDKLAAHEKAMIAAEARIIAHKCEVKSDLLREARSEIRARLEEK